jgi:hypothetical protein
MMWRSVYLIAMMAGLMILASCTVSTSLVPVLPEEEGRFGVSTEVRQPFYAEDDGLHKLTVRFYPEGFPGSQLPIDPSHGATVEVNYAPDDDPRFPGGAFHEWPGHQEWLPELAGEVSYEQAFCSPYPDLIGIEVRVATFWGDLTPGTGVLKPFETVEMLDLPIVGRHVGFVPGGSEVEVVGATEGWARVLLGDDERGWIDMEHFEELPPPARVNDKDVILEVLDPDSGDAVRTSTVNASDMFDVSHVTFEFPVLQESQDNCYRFRLTSPESEPGNAITIRYDPDGSYEDGHAILNGTSTDGDIVFQPRYDLQEALYHGSLDDYEWAAPLDAFEARFDPIENTADRYLEVRIRPGESPVNIPWSRIRPPGQRPLQVEGMPEAPQGGLVFNAVFRKDVPVTDVTRITARDLYASARQDKVFYGLFGLLLLGTVAGGAYALRRSEPDGR